MISFFMILAMISMFAWPFYTIFYIPKLREKEWNMKTMIILFIPTAVLLGITFYLLKQPKDVISKNCGAVEYYQTYMTAGNKYKRKPFERITIKFEDANYARHFRFDESLVRKNKGDHVCFEFYDRKLNSHIKDSKIIKWLD